MNQQQKRKFTSGKWKVGGNNKYPHVYSEYGVIAILEPDIYKNRKGESRANALLIASAPTLLAALEQIVSEVTADRESDYDFESRIAEIARAAISKVNLK